MLRKCLGLHEANNINRVINLLLLTGGEVSEEVTGLLLFELLYGGAVREPVNCLKELETEDVKTSCQCVFELRERFCDTMKIAQQALLKGQRKNQISYDQKGDFVVFTLGVL